VLFRLCTRIRRAHDLQEYDYASLVLITVDSINPSSSRICFLLFPCRQCGALAVTASTQKTSRCATCGHANVVAKVVIIKSFDNKEYALNALRLAKIPPGQRDEISYLAGSAGDKRTTQEEIKLLFWTVKRAHPDGITEAALLERAKDDGLDVKKVKVYLEKCKNEGKILEKSGEKLKIT
jgi:hypothetical protein